MQIFTLLFPEINKNFAPTRSVFFAKKDKKKGESSKEENSKLIEFTTKLKELGEAGEDKEIKEKARRAIASIETFGKDNSIEKNCQEILGVILDCAKKDPAQKNLADFLGGGDKKDASKKSKKELKTLVLEVTAATKSEEYKAELNKNLEKHKEHSIIKLSDGTVYTIDQAYSENAKNADGGLSKELRDELRSELISYEYGKAYQARILQGKFIFNKILTKATEEIVGLDPNKVGQIKDLFIDIQNEVKMRNLSTLEDETANKIRENITKTLEGEDGADFRDLEVLINQGSEYKNHLSDVENIILSLNATQVGNEIYKDIHRKNLEKRATTSNRMLKNIKKSREEIANLENKIAKLRGENGEDEYENKASIKELKEKLNKLREELNDDILARTEYAEDEKEFRAEQEKYMKLYGEDLNYEKFLFENWKEENKKNDNPITQKSENENEMRIIEEYDRLSEEERQEKYIEAKEFVWLKQQERESKKITEQTRAGSKLRQKWQSELNKKNYVDAIKEYQIEKEYELFNEEKENLFEEIVDKSELNSAVNFFEKVISESSQKSHILECVKTDPKLGDMAIEIFGEACALYSKYEINKTEKEEAHWLFNKSKKIQGIFSEMQAYITQKVEFIHKMKKEDEKADEKHKKELGKYDKKISSIQEKLETSIKREEKPEKIEKIEEELKKAKEEKKNEDDNWHKTGKRKALKNFFDEEDRLKEEDGEAAYEAYSKLEERIYKDEKEKDKNNKFRLTLKWFTPEQIIKSVKDIAEAWKKERQDKLEYGASEFSNYWFLDSKSKLGSAIEKKIFKQQLSYWKDELGKFDPSDIAKMLEDEDSKLKNRACFFVAVELLVSEANFGGGWANEHVKNIVNSGCKAFPKYQFYNGRNITFNEDPYHYMDTLFGQTGWAAGQERKQSTNLEGLFNETHKAYLAKFTTPPPGETQKSICEDIVNKGHQQMNAFQLAGAFKAARDHKQGMFKPINELVQVHKILVNQGEDADGPVNQMFTHSLCGDGRERHTLLDYFVVNASEPEKLKEAFKALRRSPQEYLEKYGIPQSVKRLSEKAATISDLSKLSSAEAGFDIILTNKAAFKGWISETNNQRTRKVEDDRIQAFLKLTDGNGKIGKMWDEDIDWRSLNIEKHTGYSSFDVMIAEKRKTILTSPTYRHLKEAEEYGYGPDWEDPAEEEKMRKEQENLKKAA